MQGDIPAMIGQSQGDGTTEPLRGPGYQGNLWRIGFRRHGGILKITRSWRKHSALADANQAARAGISAEPGRVGPDFGQNRPKA